ncbi:MAG TPA: LUD domain-containing protein [Myxococcota bacterium]|nr:LUD domain-containing protein [Myxococcota bacterium]
MSARDAILAALGGGAGAPPAPPPLYAPEPAGDTDLLARFATSLAAAGGEARALREGESLADALAADPVLASAARVWSSLPEVASRHPGGSPRAPHDLDGTDVAWLRGALGVAESGAVWWVPCDPLERAAGFLSERVVFVVPRSALVADLHAAYARIDLGSKSFGCFVCGPSKTADIEQALVIGAHGPRALTVILLDDLG